MERPVVRTAAARSIVAAAVLALATGCSSGIAGPLGKSAEDASSAAASLALALRLQSAGKATGALARTTAKDMLAEATKAYRQAAEEVPAGSADLGRQQEVLQALDRAVRSVQAARLAAGSGDARARELAAGDLQRQARELSRLGRELKP